MDRDDIIKALREEIEAVDSADGKGVAIKEPKEMKKPSDATKTEKVKLDGGGGTVGGDGGGAKGGKAAEGADKPAIEKADGKSVASAKVGDAKGGGGTDGKAIEKADGKSVAATSTGKAKFGGGTDGKAMEKADGKGVAAATVKASPDLKGDNTVGESITLPHDVLVEMDGKQTTLKAGTRVMVVKEEECKDEKKDEKKEECKDEKKVEEAKEEVKDENDEKKDEKVEESKVVKEDELPSFLKDDEGGEGAGEEAPADPMGGDIGGEDLPGEGGAFEMPPPKGSEAIEGSALDKIVASLDNLADNFAEFAQEEKGEAAHGGEGEGAVGGEGGEIEIKLEGGEEEDAPAEEKEGEEDKEEDFAAKLESINKKKSNLVK
jgi:hypothetical protein